MAVPKREFREGRYVFKVMSDDIWRRIAVSAEATLEQLGDIISASVDFDDDHLDRFTYTNQIGLTFHAFHPCLEDVNLHTDEVKVGELLLQLGSKLNYLFDFGDNWHFKIVLEVVETEKKESELGKLSGKVTKRNQPKRKNKKRPIGEILESHGQAPEQYPDFY